VNVSACAKPSGPQFLRGNYYHPLPCPLLKQEGAGGGNNFRIEFGNLRHLRMDLLITSHILTIITFTPAAGAFLILFYRPEHIRSIRVFALIIAILTFALSLHLIAHFDSTASDYQFTTNVPWIPSIGISYAIGLDGISLFLILLTAL